MLSGVAAAIGCNRHPQSPVSSAPNQIPTAGPMARTVQDAAILLGVIAGVDSRDKGAQESTGKSYTDYTRFLDPNGLQGARIGVARKYFGFNNEVDRLMNDAIEVMKRSGATVIDPVNLALSKEYEDSELEVLLYEFKHDLNKYLSELGPKARFRSLKEIIEADWRTQGFLSYSRTTSSSDPTLEVREPHRNAGEHEYKMRSAVSVRV